MSYEEYIDILDKLSLSNSIELKDKLLSSDINSSLIPMLEPKIINMIITKYQNTVNKMISNLEMMFLDNYSLDNYLIGFRKDISFIYDLTNVKELTEEKRNEIKKKIKDETAKVYEILINKSNQIDLTGVLTMTVKNNIINWGE